MRKTDINKYTKDTSIDKYKNKGTKKIIKKSILTLFIIFLVTVLMILSTAAIYVISLSDDVLNYDLRASKLQLSSIIYANDENGNPYEYEYIYNTENRVWVDFNEIPDNMKNAIIAIEDKRFYEHNGVDIFRTVGAMFSLFKGRGNTYGGSTITQQLIKNLTEDNEASLTRKLREIFRALNFEKKYSKDEILEAYLNVVNFGGGCRGVQSASNLYFGKDIADCSVTECACIAGITQNPSAYNPLVYPEKNKQRRDVIISEMYNQEMISKDEYEDAVKESESLTFSNTTSNNSSSKKSNFPARNWYVETLYRDLVNDLSEKLGIGKSAAEEMVLTQGLKIYSAVDANAQNIAESVIRDESIMPKDKALDLGYIMMGFDGRIMATLGCREEKTGNLWYDKANTARRQPGSTIKPIAVYTPAIDLGIYNYSSLIPDQPLNVDVYGNGTYKNWPNNWYKSYKGYVTLQWAIEKSANAPCAQVLNVLTPQKSYEFLKEKLGFYSLDPKDGQSLAPLSAGGTHIGVTVREMTAAFQIYGNGGFYHKPYTYYYVMDKDGKMLLDNRNNVPVQAVNSKTATIMNRLLRHVITGPEGTGRSANIDGWNVIGKTGTTNDDHDSWFIGATPYAVAGIWTGYDNPKRITETSAAIRIWKNIMLKFLNGKPNKDYNYDTSVVTATYCQTTGKLANTSACYSTATGYYAPNNMPNDCNGNHNIKSIINTETNIDDSTNTQESENVDDINNANNTTIKSEHSKQNNNQNRKSNNNNSKNQNNEQNKKKTTIFDFLNN